MDSSSNRQAPKNGSDWRGGEKLERLSRLIHHRREEEEIAAILLIETAYLPIRPALLEALAGREFSNAPIRADSVKGADPADGDEDADDSAAG